MTTKLGVQPRRAPIEEASIPQPRSPPLRDTANEPTLMTQVSDKLSKAMHNVKESAEEVADKIKESVVGAAHKAETTLESSAQKVEGSAKRAGDKLERMGERASEKVKDTMHDRTLDEDARAREWAAEEKRIRERVSRDWASQHHADRSDESSTWDSIKDWFRGNHDHLSEHTRSSPSDFNEGADMAEREAYKRLDRLAKETERKIEDARRAADVWERGAKEQVSDAWENARFHTNHLLKQQAAHLPAGSLAQTLKQVKDDNKRMQQMYLRDVCESHINRPQCYSTVKKMLGLAKENARIKVALEDKHIKSH